MTLVKVNNRPFSQFMEGFIDEFPTFGKAFGQDQWAFPSTNIHETADAYHVELNVPGRNKEDFKIQAENGLLTVSSEKKEETKKDDYKTISREFSYRSFKRSFTIDHQVNAGGIQAKYENGLLKLLIPKKEESKPSTVQIKID